MALINYITQVQFDYGALALLQQECDRIGIRKPLIVTDVGIPQRRHPRQGRRSVERRRAVRHI